MGPSGTTEPWPLAGQQSTWYHDVNSIGQNPSLPCPILCQAYCIMSALGFRAVHLTGGCWGILKGQPRKVSSLEYAEACGWKNEHNHMCCCCRQNKQASKRANKRTSKQTHQRADKQTGRQMNKQTNTHCLRVTRKGDSSRCIGILLQWCAASIPQNRTGQLLFSLRHEAMLPMPKRNVTKKRSACLQV